ncbi:MAG: hypothetical protein FJZ05_01460, partial [Candidatus Nealsonbacteria bacterium]|nr:hypothetical protein [Candidatus Nealsonbacteria bacterium]
MLIPKEVKTIIEKLKKAGFQAFIVGGCVRDILRKAKPEDWDIATNAKPEQTQKLFPKSFYENKFLTVTVQTGNKTRELKEVEITTYRSEAKYSDKRHPDEVKFAETIKEDLARRDFTVNAIALTIEDKKQIIEDHFNGQKDLKAKLIKAVGDPEKRFSEDALRMMRAVRFFTSLNNGKWQIEQKTAKAMKNNAHLLKEISKERIRDELVKIIMS